MQNRYQESENLPTLIFVEVHNDPATPTCLNTIFPKLKTKGYHKFLNEMERNSNLQTALQNSTNLIKDLVWLTSQMSTKGLDIQNKNDVVTFVNEMKLEPKKAAETIVRICALVKKAENIKQYKHLYLYFQSEDITYKAIDMVDVEDFRKNATKQWLIDARDILMAEEYLNNENDCAVGRHGVRHTVGMQKYILKHLSKEAAWKKFCFIYIYSQPAVPFEKKVRNGEIDFPLGLVQIDARNKNQDEIEKIIFLEIEKRQAVSILSDAYKNYFDVHVSRKYNWQNTNFQFFSSYNKNKGSGIDTPLLIETSTSSPDDKYKLK